MRIRLDGDEVVLEFAENEAPTLSTLFVEFLAVLDDDADPAAARLFPDGYRGDDEAAAEFRRYTRDGLRDRKRAGATRVRDAIGPEVRLSADEATAWLAPLTDLRLVLAERIGIRSDDDEVPDTVAGEVYGWLGYLQESILRLLEMREDRR